MYGNKRAKKALLKYNETNIPYYIYAVSYTHLTLPLLYICVSWRLCRHGHKSVR